MSWFRRRRPEPAKPNAVDLFAAATDDLGRFDPVLYAALLADPDHPRLSGTPDKAERTERP